MNRQQEGFLAFLNKQSINPYDVTDNAWAEWDKGWHDAHDKAVQMLRDWWERKNQRVLVWDVFFQS